VGISGPTVNASFVYDGVGRREKKTINGSLTEFLYDFVNPVQEKSGAMIVANILPGLVTDEFLARTDVVAGTTSNILTDALGSPVGATDNIGALQTNYSYEPFGRTTVTGALDTSSFQYTGRENDGTGLYYYRARYYHPGSQRFISEDPIEIAGGDYNLYAYVKNDPANKLDPLGLFFLQLRYWNGNFKDGFDEQDAICTVPTFMQFLDRNPCTQKCCEVHDDCYTTYRCNASSWIGFLQARLPASCQACNLQVVACMARNIGRNKSCCEK
jgi:RHS repeat-associated protein